MDDHAPEKVAAEIGKQLSRSRLNKDSLVKLLKQASTALSSLRQSSSLRAALEPLNKALVQRSLLLHKDKDVKLLVAVCFSEILRILAPDPPFSDESLKGVFKVIIGSFADLADLDSPYFTRRVKILETIASLKYSLLLLDIGCDSLILEMFNIFFSIVRKDHQESLINSILSIMAPILEEKPCPPIMDLILQNLLKEDKDDSSASFKLAFSVIQCSASKLEPFVREFLMSCIFERDATGNELKESYHTIIVELYKCSPQMLVTILPNLAQELVTDQVDVRMKAVNTVGKILALSKLYAAQEYHLLFAEFIKRYSDKSAEVRIHALECAKTCYMSNSSATAALEILTALEGRLLDFDDKVRSQAVATVCDLAISHPSSFPPKLVLQALERLRDKKVTVRRKTTQKLLQLYRAYCVKCSDGLVTYSDHFERIPSKIITLCFDKDCLEFSPQNMEIMLAEELFPASLSVEERANHWISFTSFFLPPQNKALSSILCQKRRLQMEMHMYLDLREKEKDNFSESMQHKISAYLSKMSTSFLNPTKAEEGFQMLHQMKDNHIFKALLELLNEQTTFGASQSIRDSFLRRIGNKHPYYNFFKILTLKCSHSIFTTEHVLCFLKSCNCRKGGSNDHAQRSAFDLFSMVVNTFPQLLRGSEGCFLKLFTNESSPSKERLLRILGWVGPHVSIKLSDIYPYLEQTCLNGTKAELKYAIFSIASLMDSCDQPTINELCKKLLRFLKNGENIQNALLALGYAVQNLSTSESLVEQISEFIFDNMFYSTRVQPTFEQLFNGEKDSCTDLWKLKVYGLTTLAKCFLGCHSIRLISQLRNLLYILIKILEGGEDSDTTALSETDNVHLRLAAAKMVLLLSTRWDLHFPPHLFHLTVMRARDQSHVVREAFLTKLHVLSKRCTLPCRYLCAFALAPSGYFNQADRLAELIENYSYGAQPYESSSVQQEDVGAMMNRPEYIVVFLIHTLAHDQGFPSDDSGEDAYAKFCWPLYVVFQAFISRMLDGSKGDITSSVSYLLGIFRAINKAEDVIDARITHKLQMLSRIGILMVKKLTSVSRFSPSAPQKILLPSSFYKVKPKSKGKEEWSTNEAFNCEEVVEKILRLKPKTEQSSSLGGKRPDKCQGNYVLSDSNNQKRKKLVLEKQAHPNKTKIKLEKRTSYDYKNDLDKISPPEIRMGKKVMASPSVSVELLGENPPVNMLPEVVLENSKPDQTLEQFPSSCGSAVTKHSVSTSQIFTNEVDVIDCISPESSDKMNGNSLSHFESIDNCKSKDLDGSNEGLVGHNISLWSSLNKCFYSGTVQSYDSINNAHKVVYENGDVKLLHLNKEKWGIITNVALNRKDGNELLCNDWMESPQNSIEESIDLLGYAISENEREFSQNRDANKGRLYSVRNRSSKRLKASGARDEGVRSSGAS